MEQTLNVDMKDFQQTLQTVRYVLGIAGKSYVLTIKDEDTLIAGGMVESKEEHIRLAVETLIQACDGDLAFARRVLDALAEAKAEEEEEEEE